MVTNTSRSPCIACRGYQSKARAVFGYNPANWQVSISWHSILIYIEKRNNINYLLIQLFCNVYIIYVMDFFKGWWGIVAWGDLSEQGQTEQRISSGIIIQVSSMSMRINLFMYSIELERIDYNLNMFAGSTDTNMQISIRWCVRITCPAVSWIPPSLVSYQTKP
jgi:hypothetical protein